MRAVRARYIYFSAKKTLVLALVTIMRGVTAVKKYFVFGPRLGVQRVYRAIRAVQQIRPVAPYVPRRADPLRESPVDSRDVEYCTAVAARTNLYRNYKDMQCTAKGVLVALDSEV